MKYLIISLLMITSATAANAGLLFEIERNSDNTATITASGTFDSGLGSQNNHILMFDDLFSFTTDGNPLLGGANSIGYDSGGTYDYFYGLGTNFQSSWGGDFYMGSETPLAGWEISGSAIIDASATDWILHNAGHTGNVYAGMPGGELAGTFRIVSTQVPEPATLLLLGLGLVGIGLSRKK